MTPLGRSLLLLASVLELGLCQFEEVIDHLTNDVPPLPDDRRSLEERFLDMLSEVRRMPEGDMMYQDDMRMTEEDLSIYYGLKAAPSSRFVWPGGVVPYRIGESSKQDAELIREGVRHWSENSCLRFRELQPDDATRDYINFFKGDGCWSRLGRVGGRQNISIGDGCQLLSTVVHEIGHAIGFVHEQSRRDRNLFLRVKYENILDGLASQFDQDRRRNIRYGARYDYMSVMHYSQYAFSADGNRRTLTPVNPLNAYLIRRQGGLSFRDRKKASYLYQCSAACSDKPRCRNEGFVDENCKCVCPDNAIGDRCESRRGSYYTAPSCGGMVLKEGQLEAPGFPIPAGICIWWIQAPRNMRVRLTVNNFRLSNRINNACRINGLEIRTEDLYKGDTFCGQEIAPRQQFTSRRQDLIIEYQERFRQQVSFSVNIEFVS